MSTSGLAGFLCDALRAIGHVQARRMFSGAGLFCDGLMIGLIVRDALYLKADGETQAAYEAEGMAPFIYEAKGRKVALGYWRAPERLLDEPDELVTWARAAYGVALRKARSKAGPGARSKGKSKAAARTKTDAVQPSKPKGAAPRKSAGRKPAKAPHRGASRKTTARSRS